jgi:2-succinyl-6-hydroxy-2,4-cyclohexadiene-1-carboxylate synthase
MSPPSTHLPVLALHGFAGGPDAFGELVAAHGGTWLRPQLAGHGVPPDLSARDFVSEVDRIAHWVREHAAGPVHLLGYSMGARVGLGLCVRHPTLVAQGTLVGVHPGFRELLARRERQLWEGRWVHLLETRGLTAFLEEWERLPLFNSQREADPRRWARLMQTRRSQRAEGLARAFRVLGTGVMPDLWPALPQLQIPLCLVAGERDDKFLALARKAVEMLPRGRLEVAPGVGHNVVLESPDWLLRVISRTQASAEVL